MYKLSMNETRRVSRFAYTITIIYVVVTLISTFRIYRGMRIPNLNANRTKTDGARLDNTVCHSVIA